MRCLISCVILLDLVPHNFLLVVADSEDKSNIYKIDLQSSAMTPLLPSKTYDLADVSFDPVEKIVYWTAVNQRLIGRISVDGRNSKITHVFTDPDRTSHICGLTLDTVNRKLYYADSGNFSKIVEMNFDGSQQFTIANETGMKPWALVVDTEKRALYYTDWGDRPGIYIIDLSTYQRTTILTDEMKLPAALAIDFEERVMYWEDAFYSRIEMANLDGSGRVKLVTLEKVFPVYMALSPQYLYMTVREQSSIKRLDRKTHVMSEQTHELSGRLYGIVYCISIVARDHSTVWTVAITIGGLVLIAGIIGLSACYVAKRRRERVNAELHYTNPIEPTLTNYSEFAVDRSSSHYYESITPFDTTTTALEAGDKEKACADADHCCTTPAGHPLASKTTSTRSSNNYDYVPCARTTTKSTSAAVLESPDDGYLALRPNDD